MKKIVVFGATGTVGAYACLHLADCGHQVVAVGSRKDDNGFFASHGMEYYSVDIRNKSDFLCLPLYEVYAVVNLAGMLPARMEGYHPQQYIDINVTGALNVLEYCAKAKVNRVIYSQSISDVANLCGTTIPISSDSTPSFPIDNDHSVYSITKNAAVSLLQHYSARFGFKHYILRFPNIYLYHPNPYYYVNGEKRWQGYRLMIHKALLGEPISIWGNPSKVKDIVYVKDCCQIIQKCIDVETAPSGTYNVGTGIGTTMEDQVKGIVEVFSPEGNPSPISYDPNQPDATEYVFDMKKVVDNLGYISKYDYVAYLKDFKKEMQAQRFEKLWGKDMAGDV
ncbi:MAG: NAD(P)-dependent oxidoreductase [Prevotella sp.]|nr:NAD(P)-dependent oxidoreductase [Prevotella sp.]